MKKYFLYIALILGGAVIGSIVTSTFILGERLSNYLEIIQANYMAELGECVYKVYHVGDFESSVVALNDYSDKLKFHENNYKNGILSYDIITNLGMTHGRLFLLYDSKGKKDLAEQEYQKAVSFIGDRWHITSRNQLKEIILRFDSRLNKNK